MMKVLESAQEEPMVIENSPSETPMTGCENCFFYFINVFFGVISAGLIICCGGLYTVEPLEAVIITAFGKILHVEKEQGLHCFLPCCTWRRKVSIKV
jgi:hypothetical protein